jgi:ABC-type amino acid transport substrate-binding protein
MKPMPDDFRQQPFELPEPYGAGIKTGDPELTDSVNEVFTEHPESGDWDKTYEHWDGQYTGEDAEAPSISVDEAVELVKKNAAV